MDEAPTGASNGGNAIALTPIIFLGKDGSPPYFTPKDWLDYGKSMAPSDVKHLKRGIDALKAGYRNDGGSDLMVDVAGRQYIYYTFFKAKARPGAKIIAHAGMFRLFNDYADGKVTILFTMEELIAEANKEQ